VRNRVIETKRDFESRCGTDPARTKGPVPSGRERLRRSGPPRPGTGSAGHGKADPCPTPYGVPGAFGPSWASDAANLVTHSSQMKISVSLAKLLESLTGYSAPKRVCTCW
jgi:hypothetical protein